MKKILVSSFLLLGLLTYGASSFAQEIATPLPAAEAPTKSFWRNFTFVFSNLGSFLANNAQAGESDIDSEFEVGYFITDRIQLGLLYGTMASAAKSSGGSLEDSQYVEQKSTIQGNYLAADIKYHFWKSDSGKHSFFAGVGAGQMWAQTTYGYDRYAPNPNAPVFCFSSDCDKNVVETESASGAETIMFSRLSLGYAWNFAGGQHFDGFILTSGINYMNYDSQSQMLGQNHPYGVGTDLLGVYQVYVGFGTHL